MDGLIGIPPGLISEDFTFDGQQSDQEDIEDSEPSQLRPGIKSRQFTLPPYKPTADDVTNHLMNVNLKDPFPKWSKILHILPSTSPGILPLERSPVIPGYLSPRIPSLPSASTLLCAPMFTTSTSVSPPSVPQTQPIKFKAPKLPIDWSALIVGSSRFSNSIIIPPKPPSECRNLTDLLPSGFTTIPKSIGFKLFINLNDANIILHKVSKKPLLKKKAHPKQTQEEEQMEMGLESIPTHRRATFDSLHRGFGEVVVHHPEPTLKLKYTYPSLPDHVCRRWHRPRLSNKSQLSFNKFSKVVYSPQIPDEDASTRQSDYVVPIEAFSKPSDLSCSEGDLVLVEHTEEIPPLLRNFGMAVRLVVYRKEPPEHPIDEPHGIVTLVPEGKSPNLLGGSVLENDPQLEKHRKEKLMVLEDNLSTAVVNNQRVSTPAGSRDYLLVVSKSQKKEEPSKVYLRKIEQGVFVAGQQQPKVEVYGPDTNSDKQFVRDRLFVGISRLLAKSNRLYKPQLEGIFSRFTEQNIKKALKELCVYESNSYYKKRPDVSLPSEDQLRQRVTPEAVVKQEARVYGELFIQDLKFHRFKNAPTTIKQAGQRTGMSPKARALGRVVDGLMARLPWKHTSAFVSTYYNSKGLLAVPDDVPALGLFTYIRLPQKPDSRAHRREEEPKTRVVTGTDADLRKVPPERSRQLLLRLGVVDAEIIELDRWQRVDKLRKMATKAASEGCTDPDILLYARNDKVTLRQTEHTLKIKAAKLTSSLIDQLSVVPNDNFPSTRFTPPHYYFGSPISEEVDGVDDQDNFFDDLADDDMDDDVKSEHSEEESGLLESRRGSMPNIAVTDMDTSLSTFRRTSIDRSAALMGSSEDTEDRVHMYQHLPIVEEKQSDGSIKKLRTAHLRPDLDRNLPALKRDVVKRIEKLKDRDEYLVEYVINPKDADSLIRRAKTLKSKLRNLHDELAGKVRKRRAPKEIPLPPPSARKPVRSAAPPSKISRREKAQEEEEVIQIRDRSSRKRMTDVGARVELNKFLHDQLVSLKQKVIAKLPSFGPLFIFLVEPDYSLFWDYKKIIKQPFWIEKMILKSTRDEYKDRQGFIDDVRLMVHNAHLYNSKKDWYNDVLFQIDMLWTRMHEIVLLPDNDKTLARFERVCSPQYHEHWCKERNITPNDPVESATVVPLPQPPKDTRHILSFRQMETDVKIQAKESLNKMIANLIDEVSKYDCALHFLKKPSARDFPTYRHFVKKPFSLNEVLQKAQQKKYKCRKEVEEDLDLIVNNAVTFNSPLPQNHWVIDNAQAMRNIVLRAFEILSDQYKDLEEKISQ
ncbi:hypothetical protein P9112_012448 [Eukaryota sp. TZLM1-RC]